ncbi:hypothetical protein L1S32_09420 [Methanogenium sp. S4BF]|uniref:hypothetical protein n=1 Tax=Methanogenium sp. S4BF TaxID=1789226 RepID=UPI002416C669|nr:hypothetical protein [Methanogenium sp. S4BF]WFN34060.1 hypothetical protein L1S32_09420 [Methanogenium sp. S4BF]
MSDIQRCRHRPVHGPDTPNHTELSDTKKKIRDCISVLYRRPALSRSSGNEGVKYRSYL